MTLALSPAVTLAPALPAGIPVIRPVRATATSPQTATRQGDTVLTPLTDDPETAGAHGTALLLRAPHIAIDGRGLPAATAAALAAGACLRAWHTPRWAANPPEHAPRLAAITLVTDDPETHAAWAATAPGIEGALYARDLVSTPANLLTPTTFAARLGALTALGLTLEVLDAAALRQLGCGGLLAVGGGSAHPPCMAILRWPGSQPPVALIGKGITFDTGSISIKPADRLWEMRADMAGAAACAGAMLALARRRSPRAAIAVLPLAENTTGGASYRPGDVLRMANGSTVAVVDTDAEGRLVLADALAWAARQPHAALIDIATLTGSIVTALGHEHAGAFGTDAPLRAAAIAAGQAVGERLWPMPIEEADLRALDSTIADIRHCVDARGQPDASQAAAFLRSFTGSSRWLHLDIAGVEQRPADQADDDEPQRYPPGATGFGARLLDRLIATHFEPPHG